MSAIASERLRFTVAVCTLNRAPLLERALDALARQALTIEMEVLVIDNGSIDETRALTERRCKNDPRFRYVLEPEVGLSQARNRGWREARGEYIAYTDDDAVVPADWLVTAAAIADAHGPTMFGGPYRALFDAPPPTWFDVSFGSYEPTTKASVLDAEAYIPGANLFVRRDVVEEVGGFDPAFGMRGTRLGFGEEVDLLTRVRERYGAASVHYDPALCVLHRVDPKKLHLWHFARSRFTNGRDFGRRMPREQQQGAPLFLRIAWNLMLLGGLGFDVALRDRERHPSATTYAVRRALPRVWNLGHIYGVAKARREVDG